MQYKVIQLEQGTPEWLEFRTQHIGASDAPVIMGVSPWKDIEELKQEKQGYENDNEINYFQAKGLVYEQDAREDAMELFDAFLLPCVVQSTKHEFAIASLDGLDEEKCIAVEIKCPGKKDHELAKTGRVPIKYYPQLQHQLMVLGYEYLFYVSYFEEDIISIKVEKNEDYIYNLLQKEKDFLNSLTVENLQDNEVVDMGDSPSFRALVEELRENREENLILSEKKKENEKKYKILLDEVYRLTKDKDCIGRDISISRSLRKGSINYSLIKELDTMDLEQYRKPSTVVYHVKFGEGTNEQTRSFLD